MANESRLIQNISVRADGAALLRPIQTTANEVSRIVTRIGNLFDSNTQLTKRQRAELEQMVKRMGQLTGQASNLERILDGLQTKKQNRSLFGLDDQALGRQAQSAALLRRGLQDTTSAATALEVRLTQLRQRFADLATAGRKVNQRELSKALGTEQAIADVKRLETQLARLDTKVRTSGVKASPELTALRASVGSSQDALLKIIQNPRRSNFGSEIANLRVLIGNYEKLAAVEAQAALAANRASAASLRSLQAQARESQEMLRARLQRGASQYSFTETQARTIDPTRLAAEQDRLFARAMKLRSLMADATAPGSTASTKYVDGLNKAWQALTGRISEAMAKQKAFDNLPENRAARTRQNISDALFGDGGIGLGSRVLAVQGIFAAINAIQGGARFIAQYEDALAQLQAIAGATDIEMRTLGASILDISKTTKFSAVEITQAATTIAQAGFSAAETGRVLRDALTLATASGSSPTAAVDTLTSTLGAFQLQATESTHVVDVMVEALNRSKLSIEQLQAAIQYAGATAMENGIQFEELAAIAGSLANAGIRSGSTIGTGLRQLLVDLKTPTDKFRKSLEDVGLTMADVDVKTNGVAEVVRKLTEAGFTAQQAYNSFEVRAASAFLAFRNQLDTYDQLALSLANAGAAADAQGVAMDSLSAKGQRLLNVVGELVVILSGPYVDSLKLIADLTSVMVMGITDMIKGLGELTGSVSDGSAAVTGFNALLSGTTVGLTAFFLTGGNPVAGAIGGLVGFASAIYNSSSELERLKTKTNEASAALDASTQTIDSADKAIQNLVDRETTLRENKVALQTETINLTNKFEGLSNVLRTQAQDYDELLAAMLRYRAAAAEQAAEDARTKRLAAEAERGGLIRAASFDSNQGIKGRIGEQLSRSSLDPRLRPILEYFQGAVGANYGSLNSDQLSASTITFQGRLNDLKELQLKGTDAFVEGLIRQLNDYYTNLLSLRSNQSVIELSRQQEGLYRAQASPVGQNLAGMQTAVQGRVNTLLTGNQRVPGSQNNDLAELEQRLNSTLNQLQASADQLEQDSPYRKVIEANMLALRGQVSRIISARRADQEAAEKDLRSLSGGTPYTATQVGALLTKDFGVRVTGTDRSLARQQELYRNYPGVAAPSANAPHVSGRAVDIAPPGNGITPDQLKAYLEKKGFSGVRIITQRHGTGAHWHIQWDHQNTSGQQVADQQAERDARAFQQLLEQTSGTEVSAKKAAITAIIDQAKAGILPVADASSRLDTALGAYRESALRDYDVSNPIAADATPNERALIAQGRVNLEEKLREEMAGFHAKLWKEIGDAAATTFDNAIKALDAALEETQRQNELPVVAAQQQVDVASNGLNSATVGVGTQYKLSRNLRNAQLTRDQANLSALEQDLDARRIQRNTLAAAPAGEVGSESYIAHQQKILSADQAIAEAENKITLARSSIAAQTERLLELPLPERIRESITAWAEQSGVMDSLGKTIENSVGPALDTITTQFATFFTNVATGATTFQSALKSMMAAFAQFVVQIIAKALALMAVKAILSAFGLNLTATDTGVVIGNKPKGSFNGGLVANDNIPGLMGGGRVNRGFSTHDSALYNLAEGEYVVRNRSVKDLGIPFMDAINKHGSQGLAKMAGTNIFAGGGSRQETNVYVVQPQSKPQLGPNDVLIVLQEDILQGGVTKKLIKQVAQGA